MESFFESKGKLKVVVAKGVISTYEVNSLEKGKHVYFSDRECGQPCSLYFNDRLIGYCHVIIIDNKFAVRMEKIRDWCPDNVIRKSLLDDNDLLNCELVLGERTAQLKDIIRLTVGSIIPIITEIDYTNNLPMIGKIIVSGLDVATGKICVADENWAIEVVKPLFKPQDNIPRRDSFLPTGCKFKYYDFSRPDCLSRTHIKGFLRIHQFFGNYIGAKVELVDQMTWKELKDEDKNSYFIQINKEEIKTQKTNDNSLYYLSLDENSDNEGMENFSKEYANKSANDQVMERIGLVYDSTNIKNIFKENFEETMNLLEASWRDKTLVSFGSELNDYTKIQEADFISDYEMIVIVKMTLNNDEFTLVYPLAYFIQILNELN